MTEFNGRRAHANEANSHMEQDGWSHESDDIKLIPREWTKRIHIVQSERGTSHEGKDHRIECITTTRKFLLCHWEPKTSPTWDLGEV